MKPLELTPQLAAQWLRPRPADSHKDCFGRAFLVAGSRGMMGAALLAARACMRGGVGLLTVQVPACGYDILQLGIPEAKCLCDTHPDHHTHLQLPADTEVVGIGPGLGQHPDVQQALHQFLLALPQHRTLRGLVLDADALNILALHPEWLTLLPPGTILTPHPGEMQRLGGDPRLLSDRHQLTVVLKGHHTQIFVPTSNSQIVPDQIVNNACGNPGMAVGGSGDVLTGLILALLAQHYPPMQAAALGVWLHATAADLALADGNSVESLLPSDIISHLGRGFREIYRIRINK